MLSDNRQEGQETQFREWLQSLDPLLDIVYIPWAERYSLICNWPQADPRWAMFQSGEIGAHYDSLGWLCKNMGDADSLPVSLDECESIVIERLNSCDNTQASWKTRMGNCITHNRKVKDDRKQIALEQVEEVASSLRYMAGRVDANKLESIMQEVSQGVI